MQIKNEPRVCPHCHISVGLAAKDRCTNIGCGKLLEPVRRNYNIVDGKLVLIEGVKNIRAR